MNDIEHMTKEAITLSEKTKNDYIKMAHPIRLRWFDNEDDAYYIVSIPSLPDCVTHGYSVKEALREVMAVKGMTIETMMKHNLPIVEFTETTPVIEIAEPFSKEEIKEMEDAVIKMIGILNNEKHEVNKYDD